MCGDDDHCDATDPWRHSRRQFLKGLLAAGAVALVPSALRDVVAPAPAFATESATQWLNPSGETAYRAAMHLHASFSEGQASWAQHFDQAVRHGIDILVPTEHDWRLERRDHVPEFHFSGWSEAADPYHWILKQSVASANLTAESVGELVTPGAPSDTSVGAGALRLVAGSTTTQVARMAYAIRKTETHGSVLGRTLSLWVKPVTSTNHRATVGLRLRLATDPKYRVKRLVYRLRTDLDVAPAPTVIGGTATIDVPAVQGEWHQLVLDVASDIAACWPDVLAADNSINRIETFATGTLHKPVEGLFSHLNIAPDPSFDPLSALAGVVGHYQAAYPDLFVPHGMEHSYGHHMNQIGGTPFLYQYPEGMKRQQHDDALTADQVAQIRNHGGTISYNHPFGTRSHTPTSPARETILRSVMESLLSSRCFGMDMLEVGYVSRGMDLAGHLELFDCMSANGVFVTATGVSDDHSGHDWLKMRNRFLTIPWMSTLSEDDFKSALRHGRATVGLLGSFTGAMDISINDAARMGEVYTAAEDPADVLVINGFGIPADAFVHVWCGPVDHAGADFQRPAVVASVAGADFELGSVSVPATGSGPRYYRCTVVGADGHVIAFTNPVWRMDPTDTDAVPPTRLWSAA